MPIFLVKKKNFANSREKIAQTESSKQDMSKSKRQIELVLSYIRSQLAYDLIYGNILSVKEIWERLDVAGLRAVPTNAMVIKINNFERLTANKSEMWKTKLRADVQRIIEQCLAHLPTVLVVTVEKHLVAVLFRLPKGTLNAKREIIEISKRIWDEVERQTSFVVTISLGRRYSDASNLHLSYQECLAALQHNFWDNSRIVHIDDIEPCGASNKVFMTYSLEEESLLATCVRLGNIRETERILGDIFHGWAKERVINPRLLKNICLQLVTVVTRAAIEGGVNEEACLTASTQNMNKIMQVESMRDLMELVVSFTIRLASKVRGSRSRKMSYATKQVITFLVDNIRKNITLEQIAKSVHLSPFYLSHQFKKEIGMTITEYLTKLRLQEARKLLSNRHWSVREIAHLVGYQNPNYFSRIFKKEYGLSPSEFRRQNGYGPKK